MASAAQAEADATRATRLLELYAVARGGEWEVVRWRRRLRADVPLAALAARVFAHPLTGFTFLHVRQRRTCRCLGRHAAVDPRPHAQTQIS
jgi:hypothetical protein